MKRLPPSALAACACTFLFFACGSEPEPATPDPPPATVEAKDFTEIDSAAASASFMENVESKLDILKLADRASSALVRTAKKEGSTEMVYIFAGMGDPDSVAPVMKKLANKWPSSLTEECWIPWEELIDMERGKHGPCMGAFRSRDWEFQLTLFIDVTGSNFFVCYTSPAPGRPSDEPPSEASGSSAEKQ